MQSTSCYSMSAVDPDMYHIASKATRNMNKSFKKEEEKKMIGPLLQILLLLDTVARIIDAEDKRLFFLYGSYSSRLKKKC